MAILQYGHLYTVLYPLKIPITIPKNLKPTHIDPMFWSPKWWSFVIPKMSRSSMGFYQFVRTVESFVPVGRPGDEQSVRIAWKRYLHRAMFMG